MLLSTIVTIVVLINLATLVTLAMAIAAANIVRTIQLRQMHKEAWEQEQEYVAILDSLIIDNMNDEMWEDGACETIEGDMAMIQAEGDDCSDFVIDNEDCPF